MTTNTKHAIETHNLTKNYRFKSHKPDHKISLFKRRETRIVKAIDDLNLQIRKGELFGLLGPNGAGKTTLVKILCTLLPPDNGTATVNGFDVTKQSMEVKKSIGTLFSVGERGFFWRLTGFRNLEFFAAILNVPRQGRGERIMEVLDLLGLKEYAHAHFQKYSGGQKRKLALARTLLADPPILLLDEPTSALDVMSSRNIREFIRNDLTKKAGKTVLYTTHHVEEAAQICDRIAVLNKGKLIALDTPEALKEMANKRDFVEFVVGNISDNQVNTLRKMGVVNNLTAETLEIKFNQTRLRMQLQNPDLLPAILNFFFKNKIRLVNFKREEATLEDAFVEITKRRPAQ